MKISIVQYVNCPCTLGIYSVYKANFDQHATFATENVQTLNIHLFRRTLSMPRHVNCPLASLKYRWLNKVITIDGQKLLQVKFDFAKSMLVAKMSTLNSYDSVRAAIATWTMDCHRVTSASVSSRSEVAYGTSNTGSTFSKRTYKTLSTGRSAFSQFSLWESTKKNWLNNDKQ